jgi:hypothetical protein
MLSCWECGLFSGQIQLSPANADKIILAGCVLHSNLRNDLSVDDSGTENTDAPSQSPYITTFHRSGGNANKEVMSVREKYWQYFENIGSALVFLHENSQLLLVSDDRYLTW